MTIKTPGESRPSRWNGTPIHPAWSVASCTRELASVRWTTWEVDVLRIRVDTGVFLVALRANLVRKLVHVRVSTSGLKADEAIGATRNVSVVLMLVSAAIPRSAW